VVYYLTVSHLREETGIVGLAAFAGTVGLLFHAGANTFIIVRIMEPLRFFAGIVVALPALPQAEARAARQPAGTVRYAL
jgi:energy-converting hydrogenase Eha subunit B